MNRKTLTTAILVSALVLAGIGILALKYPTLFGLRSHTGMTGENMPEKVNAFLLENGIVDGGEKILYFYSPGMFGFESDGNIMTGSRVISYWETDGKRQSRSAGFGEISGLALHRKGGMKHDTILAVETVNGNPIVLFLSAREGWDEEFMNALKAEINDPSGFGDEKQVVESAYRDPNERAVPDQRDIKYFSMMCGEAGIVRIEIGFYSDIDVEKGMSSVLSVSGDGDMFPELAIVAQAREFAVAREEEPGSFSEVLFSGTPEISGDSYRILVPWEKVFPKGDDCFVSCRELGGKDRVPNEGSLVFDPGKCSLSYMWHPYLPWMKRGEGQ